MIARFRIILPTTLYIKIDDSYTPITVTEEGYDFSISPPYQGAFDPNELISGIIPINDIMDRLYPADPQVISTEIKIDGAATIAANVLQIDVHKETFNREKNEKKDLENLDKAGDPQIQLFIGVVNSFLAKFRALTRGRDIKPVNCQRSCWRLQYLADTEEKLERNPEFYTRLSGASFFRSATGLNSATWSSIKKLPDNFTLSPWRNLLLDALDILPEVGPAIVLAYTALEVLIEHSLNTLASKTAFSKKFWEWIIDRDDDYRKEASVTEKFDILLEAVAGKSLKTEGKLWEGFINLKKARNGFVHNGVPTIGKGKKVVTVKTASELVDNAEAIIEWIEALLPADFQHPKLEKRISIEQLVATIRG